MQTVFGIIIILVVIFGLAASPNDGGDDYFG